MKIKLAILEGKHRGRKITLPPTQFVIGRDSTCHLRPVSRQVSKFHCAIARMGTRVLVRDLKSTNGTYLNDERISGTKRVRDGDILKVGPLRFLFQVLRNSGSRSSNDSSLNWLLRSPNKQENKVLDAETDMTFLKDSSPDELGNSADEAKSADNSSRNASAIAGRYLHDYLNENKRTNKRKSDIV